LAAKLINRKIPLISKVANSKINKKLFRYQITETSPPSLPKFVNQLKGNDSGIIEEMKSTLSVRTKRNLFRMFGLSRTLNSMQMSARTGIAAK
jgi:hypothetical protein